ncbi:MAG: BTAD domain-containing putative transcriptional regulator [Gemmatimonadales bacterium]
MIRLQTLGALDLRNSEGSELRPILAQPRRLALLAYLAAASPHGFQRRDKLITLFWPDQNSDRARASLSRAVYFLRRELGDDIVLSRGAEEVGLDSARFWCDAAAFAEALDHRRYRDALELYRGDILPGFFASDAPGFEEWIESERARLKERASVAAWALADEEETAGDLASAAQWARRGLELSPFREVGLRRLLALLDRAGDRVGAAWAYERFADEITAELDLDPSPETRALIDAIRSRANLRLDPSPSSPSDAESMAGPRRGGASAERVTGSPVEAAPATPDGIPPAPPSASRGRHLLVGALSMIALGVLLVNGKALLARDETLDPMRIDVETLDNRTGDPSLDDAARSVTDRIIGGLGETGLFQSIAPVQHAELGVWRRAWAGLTSLGMRAKRERGGVIVSGAVSRERGKLLIEVLLTDINHGGRVWAVAPIPLSAARPEAATNEVRARVIGGVAALRNPYFASLLPAATAPPTFEAYQEFLEGFRLQVRDQRAEARKHYGLAAALDSSFTWPLVQSAMSALFDMRHNTVDVADSILRILSARRDRLPPLQQHLTDYMLTSRAQDWVGAYRAIRAAADLAPLYYSYSVAMRASYLSRPREAIEALLRPGMDSAHRNDAETYWLMLPLSYHQLGEYGNELDAARRARRYRPDSRSAMSQEIRALAGMGNVDAVRARLDTLVAMPKEGTWAHPAWAMIRAAEELRVHGYAQAAREVAERAVAWHQSRPAEERAMRVRRWNLAYVLYFLERWDEAEALLRPLIAESPDDEDYLGLLGATAARRGDRLTAEKLATKLAGLEQVAAVPGKTAIVNRAKIAAVLGDPARAVSLLKDAYGAQGTLELHTDIDFERLRDYLPFQEFTRPKG